jgi:hypothetical protein
MTVTGRDKVVSYDRDWPFFCRWLTVTDRDREV